LLSVVLRCPGTGNSSFFYSTIYEEHAFYVEHAYATDYDNKYNTDYTESIQKEYKICQERMFKHEYLEYTFYQTGMKNG